MSSQTTPGLADLPVDAELMGEPAQLFIERRRRIAVRYSSWRRNLPALESLLETEEEKAKALAGNLATEARAILQAWVTTQVEAEGGRLRSSDLASLSTWIDEFWQQWHRAALTEASHQSWDEETHEFFEDVLTDLGERARCRAKGQLKQATHLPLASPPWILRQVRGCLSGVGALVRRVFEPGGDVGDGAP